MIPLSKPFISGIEIRCIEEVINSSELSDNGKFTAFCQGFFPEQFGFVRAKLTYSCTAALDIVSILLNISAGDEMVVQRSKTK